MTINFYLRTTFVNVTILGNIYVKRDSCVIWVVYHLHKDSSISEWKINGTHIFGRPNRKITGINGLLEKVVLFDRLERFKRFISFHLHFFWVVVLVPNKFIICCYSFRCFESYGKWKAHTPNEIFQLTFLRSICTISN